MVVLFWVAVVVVDLVELVGVGYGPIGKNEHKFSKELLLCLLFVYLSLRLCIAQLEHRHLFFLLLALISCNYFQ